MIVPPCAEETDLESVWVSLDEQQQKLDAAERELAQTKTVLVDVLQQFRAAKNALEQARVETSATEKTCTQLRTRVRQLEESQTRLELKLRGAEMQIAELKQQIELTKSQRSLYLWETQRLSDALEGAQAKLDTFAHEREERERIVSRAQAATEGLSAECQCLEQELGLRTGDLGRALQQLDESERLRAALERETGQLRADLSACENQEVLQELRIKEASVAELELALRKQEAENLELRDRCARLEHDCSLAKEENFESRVQLAALRETASDSRLYQDNQLLRGVIERNNEQLRAMAQASRRRRFVSLEPPPEESSLKANLRWLLGLLLGKLARGREV